MNKVSDITTRDDGITTFRYYTDDISEVNMLRRSILTSIETYAIDIVMFNANKSARNDEVLAHRLGLLPIDHEYYDPDITEFSLNVEGPLNVTSEHIIGFPIKRVTPIITLRDGDKIDCKCIVVKGQGKTHVKWRSVSTCTFNEDAGSYLIKFKNIDMLPSQFIIEQGLEKMLETAERPPANIFSNVVIPSILELFAEQERLDQEERLEQERLEQEL
jgi:RNA polymerase Rpb3/Rpb11